MSTRFAAVVLAGGRSRRLDGKDKVMQPVGGKPILERTITAVRSASPVVVVGPRRELATPHAASRVWWTREDPPGGGPLAGLAAGVRALPSRIGFVAVLAADHPHLTTGTIARLRQAVAADPAAAGAVLGDQHGRAQWLVGVWRIAALDTGLPACVKDRAVRSVLTELDPILVPAVADEAMDVDTPGDLSRARDLADG